jgi:hypothetical protein
MADAKRVIRPLISLTLIGATVLGLINVFGDNSELQKQAETLACTGKENCTAHLTQASRNPIAQSFVFTLSDKASGSVTVDCHRSLYLVGEYGCERSGP